jgi:hypothetical protein
MLNRFSTTGTSEYTPQHVPLPFEEISAIGEKMQKKYDTAIDDTYKLKDLMAQVPAINDPNEGLSNIKKKAELDVKYHPRIEEITNKIASGDSNAYAELEKVKRDFINDPDRQELVNSYDNYKVYKEDKIKKGDKYAPWENPYLNQQLVDPNTGELKPFRYSGMGEVQDHQKLSDEMMKGFVESSNEFKNARLGEDGIIRTNFGKGAAITDAQIRNAANAKIIDFVGNKEGMSFLKQMKFQYPDATPEQLQQAVSDKLYHSGMNQIHNNSGGGNIIDVTSMANDLRKEQEAKPKNPWNLYAPNANPDPNNAVSKALHSANPNSAFTVGDNGEIQDLKPEDVGTKNIAIYKDATGKVWNPTNLPSGWSYKKDSWNGDYFESTGGTKVKVNTLQSTTQKIDNTDIYHKQVNEVLQWAASTGQFDKDKAGSVQYKELLPKYKAAIQNGVLNSQYIPQFDAESAANFKETFAPKLVTTANGTTVKDPGLVSNWTIDGISNDEEKMKILNNFNPIGLDMIKGGDNILISSEDGKEYSVNMNNPTLKSTFGNLSRFVRENNVAKINPTKVNFKEVLKTTENYLTNLANNANRVAQENGLNPADATNEVMYAQNSYSTKTNNLIKDGYVPTGTYQDPTTGTLAISYINHSTPGGQDVKVLKFHPGVDIEFEEMSEAAFTREVEQKAFGNFASNLNTKGSKTTGTFIENQKPTK